MGNIVGMGDRKAVRREADYIATSLKAAASVISQGMLVLDSDLRILFMNAKYREFFDLRDQEAADQEGAYFPDHLLYLAARGNYPEGMSDDQIRGRLGPIFERADYVRDRQLRKAFARWAALAEAGAGAGLLISALPLRGGQAEAGRGARRETAGGDHGRLIRRTCFSSGLRN